MPRLSLLCSAALIGFAPLARAQTPDWQIGAHRLETSGPGAAPLMQLPEGLEGLSSNRFLLQIGGVDLEAVASLPAPLHLRYDAQAPDGQRLVVAANGRTLRPNLPDWELKPIAALADSPYTADVSLFGDGADTAHRIYPRYHPALRNTLLGLRLLQADLMLTHPEDYRQMPSLDGRVVLGAGEALPDEAASHHAADTLAALLASYDYQSWVLTDVGENARLDSADLRSELDPFYYFWSSRIGEAALHLLRLTSLEGLVPKAEQAGVRKQIDAAAAHFSQLEREPASGARPMAMPDLTARMHADETMLAALNPPVWHAVQDTARYASLFRLARSQDARAWQGFVASLDAVSVQPAVRTPTAVPRDE